MEQKTTDSQRGSRFNLIDAVVGIIALLAILTAFAANISMLGRNEHMYIAAGVLVSQGNAPYYDFGYVETPYLPLIHGFLFRLFNVTSHYFQICKWISFISLLASGFVLFLIARRVLKSVSGGLSIMTLFFLSSSIIMPAAEASNYILPICFSLISFYVFSIGFEAKRFARLKFIFSGIFLAAAVGIKLTYASLALPFLATAVFWKCKDRSNQSENHLRD